MSTVTVKPISIYSINYLNDDDGTATKLDNCINIVMSDKYLSYDILTKDDGYTSDFRVYNKYPKRGFKQGKTVLTIKRHERAGLLITRRT